MDSSINRSVSVNDECLAEFPFTIPDEDLEQLQATADELIFVRDVAHLKCHKCQKLPLKHYKYQPCGHLFCAKCHINNDKKTCPTCQGPIMKFAQDANVENELACLEVQCGYCEYGCENIVQLRELQKHMKQCNYHPKNLLPVMWREKLNDPQFLQVKRDFAKMAAQFQSHLVEFRKLKNENEQLRATVQDLKTQIEGCKEQVKKMENSTSDIEQVKYQIRESHKDLRTVHQDYQKLQEELAKLQESNLNVKEVTMEVTTNPFLWKFERFHEILDHNENGKPEIDVTSKPFIINGSWPILKMAANLFTTSVQNELCISLGFVHGSDFTGTVPETFYHRRTVLLLDQSGRPEPVDVVRIIEPGFGTTVAKEWMRHYQPISLAPLSLLKSEGPYVKSGAILIKIIVEPLYPFYRHLVSTSGTILWRIEKYASKKQQEVAGIHQCWYSKYFGSGSRGYRMQVQLYLNGSGPGLGKEVRMKLKFLRGEWDEFLPEVFPHRVTYSILDQSEALVQKPLEKTVVSDKGNLRRSCVEICPLSELDQDNSAYVKNDVIMVRVKVEPL